MLQNYIDKVQMILVCFYPQQMLYWFLKHMQYFKSKVCIKGNRAVEDFFYYYMQG